MEGQLAQIDHPQLRRPLQPQPGARHQGLVQRGIAASQSSELAIEPTKEAGFFMIFYLAALQTIPPELRDAARLEGATRWQYGRRVLLPLLAPTTLFILINALINSVKLVDHLFILTKGGPNNASKLMLYWIWETAFAYMDTPSAAVLTVVLLLGLGAVAIFQFRYAERRVHYQ